MPTAPDRRPLIEKAEQLRALHLAKTILTLPNAWDVGSAKILERAGFPAIATTSSGIEFALGLSRDLLERRDHMLAAVGAIARAVRVPVTADVETGYAARPGDLADTIHRVLDAGAVGVNLEDVVDGYELAMRAGGKPALWSVDEATARIRAARAAADAAGVPLVINARTDVFTIGTPRAEALDESIRRGNAFLAAGADCIFVPYAQDADTIRALAAGINGPINILGGPRTPSIAEMQALGVARVTIGGSLSRAAMHFVQSAARELKERGTFGYAERALSYEDTIDLLG
jgi:2-methylisocitrate lyase-like PEP mutase family enzyme